MTNKTPALLYCTLVITAAYTLTLTQRSAAAPPHIAPENQPQQQTQPPNQPDEPDEQQTKTLTPLAIGNTWVFENKDDGIISTDRIEGMVLFNDKPWYLVRSTEQSNKPADPDLPVETIFAGELWLAHLGTVEADGFVEIDEKTGTLKLSNITRYYQTDAAVGDTYQPNENDPGLKIEVLAIDERVKTKAGEFKCTVYRETHTDTPDDSFTTYVAPDIGIVRYTTTEGEESSSADLIKYTLVKQNK